LPLILEPAEDSIDLVAGLRVELAGRLVGQDQDRVLDQGPRDRHPLLLASRHLVGPVVEPVAQADVRQELGRPGALFVGQAAGQERHQYVLHRRQVADQVERLEDESDPVAAVAVLLGLGHRGQVLALDPDRPRVGPVERAQQVEKRALARAGGTDDEREPSLGDPATDPAQRLDPPVAALKPLPHIRHIDHRASLGRVRLAHRVAVDLGGMTPLFVI